MSKPITIVKVMSAQRRFVALTMRPSVEAVRRLIGSREIGHKALCVMPGGLQELRVAAAVDCPQGTPGFRLLGTTETTHGDAILFGRIYNLPGPAMAPCPFPVGMLVDRIIWTEDGQANVPLRKGEIAEVSQDVG